MPEAAERELTFAQAIREALAEEMRRDATVCIMGEDVAEAGTPFKVLSGLVEEFGKDRVLDTPISEAGFTGLAVGAAMTGLRPIVDIMFGDFITLTMDQMVNQAAKVHYMSGGKWKVPMVMRTTLGATRRSAAQHSQSLHAWFSHVPGLKVVLPSTPYDAKGLLKTAIRDENPVVFFGDKMMYKLKGPVPTTPEMGRAEDVAKKIHLELEMRGLHQEPLGIDIIEPPVLFALQKMGIDVVDGQALMSEARVIKTQDEISLLNTSAMMVDAAYDELYRAMKPGFSENEAVGLVSKVLYDLGSEYVEAVNAISGERCNPHPHVITALSVSISSRGFGNRISRRRCTERSQSAGGSGNSCRADYCLDLAAWRSHSARSTCCPIGPPP